MALTLQQIQDYYKKQGSSATPLSPAQYEASLNKPISVDTLSNPANPMNVPNVPNTNYSTPAAAAATGAQTPPQTFTGPNGSVYDTSGNIIKPGVDAVPSLSDLTTKLMGDAQAPAKPDSLVSQYNDLVNTPEYQANKKQVDDLNAQLATLQAEQKSIETYDPAKDPANAGRGITVAGIQPLIMDRAEALRQNAIKQLPVIAQFNAAQGRLQSARDNIKTLLELQDKDQQATYDWYNTTYNRALAVATDEEKILLQKRQEQLDAIKTQNTEFNSTRKSFVDAAIESGDYALAAKLAGAQDMTALNSLAGTMKTQTEWSAPYLLGGDYVQKNTRTGEIRTAVNVPKTTDTTEKPLSILDIQRYQELYPDAGVIAGDTEAQANAKIAATNTPEAKLRSQISGFQSSGATYDKVVSDINTSTTIKDKATALKIAQEVYGVQAAAPAAPVYGQKNFSTVDINTRKAQLEKMGFNESQVRSQLKADGYPLAEVNKVSGNIIDKLTGWLFRE